ncbi:hypothetical protein ACRDNQ_09775 [Palleronia sp. KMU-117]|uniref:hypothetical protein n=1 Tax=Palleronia sp. KMU-117 TaxID=3434108 RepID=UPI003D72548A
MRAVVLLALLAAGPAQAWEFTPFPVCTLFHETAEARVSVTHDPRLALPYTFALVLTDTWPAGPDFSIRFDGPRPLTITTNRHVLSDGGRTLSVSDAGFGNVLTGLEFNDTATALTADRAVTLPLAGAAGEVQKFRACAEAALA